MLKRLNKVVLCILMLLPQAGIAAGVPSNGILDFVILRNGSEIGHHVIRFEKLADSVIVRIEAQVDYRIAFIPFYTFRHVSREVWRGGQLIDMTAETNDNGCDFSINVKAEGDAFRLSVNGVETPIDAGVIPASLWNIALVESGKILDPADGELMQVAIRNSGEEVINVRGRDVRARHFVMTGDFQRDLWYDNSGVLVHVRFTGEDGSEIRYELR